MSPTAALLEALNGSITSGNFADTKIYLFSHRNSEGDVCKPKALYANSAVLRSVPYFNDRGSPNDLPDSCALTLDPNQYSQGTTQKPPPKI